LKGSRGRRVIEGVEEGGRGKGGKRERRGK